VELGLSFISWSAPDMGRMVIERAFGSWHHEIWIADVVEDGVPLKGAKR
jgi:hypothetical protein